MANHVNATAGGLDVVARKFSWIIQTLLLTGISPWLKVIVVGTKVDLLVTRSSSIGYEDSAYSSGGLRLTVQYFSHLIVNSSNRLTGRSTHCSEHHFVHLLIELSYLSFLKTNICHQLKSQKCKRIPPTISPPTVQRFIIRNTNQQPTTS
jgi:hypothetical protein